MNIEILLATYNGEGYVKKLLDSLNEQTNKNFTLRIVDDCSTDETFKIVESFSFSDQISLVLNRNNKNLNWMWSYDELLRSSSSDIVIFSDQDDIQYDFKIDRVCDYVKSMRLKCEDVWAIVHKADIIDESGVCLKSDSYLGCNSIDEYISQIDSRSGGLFGCTLIISRGLVKLYKQYFRLAGIGHDFVCTLLAYHHGKIYKLDESLVAWRVHGGNSSQKRPTIATFLKTFQYFARVAKAHSVISNKGTPLYYFLSICLFLIKKNLLKFKSRI